MYFHNLHSYYNNAKLVFCDAHELWNNNNDNNNNNKPSKLLKKQ